MMGKSSIQVPKKIFEECELDKSAERQNNRI